MFSGLGGDELCGSHWDEIETVPLQPDAESDRDAEPASPAFMTDRALQTVRETQNTLDRAPRSVICSSALEAAACSSAISMRRGIWHVNPLCTPELVRFCAHLPLEWRQERTIERRLVTWLDCSENVAYPPQNDDFSPACRLSLRSHGRLAIRNLFGDSCLADLGLVRVDRLIAEYDRWCRGNDTEGDLPFYSVAILELTLRAVEASRSRVAPDLATPTIGV